MKKIRMNKAGCSLVLLLIFFAGVSGCSPGVEHPDDRYDRGTIYVSCDESFKPVIDAQVEVYQAAYPDAHIIVHYKPEAECLKDLNVDSVRMVIATRGFTPVEKKFLVDSMHVGPETLTVARDLIAVIVNKASPDTFWSMKDIRDLVGGKLNKNLIPVFDGTRATSTVRFMLDSVLRGQPLGSNVAAAQNTAGVIDYVSGTPGAVGFVGYSWIGNDDDSAQVAQRNKIKIAWVESTDSANAYVKPSQYFIYTKSYPMIRDVVYILKENYNGLGRGFADFLSGERGQLIFRRAYLMPAVNPYYLRRAQQINK